MRATLGLPGLPPVSQIGYTLLMTSQALKELSWIASSQGDLRAFPDDVKDVMGFALYEAQHGAKHPAARPLAGFKGAGVLEIVDDYDGDTYRVMYTVRLGDSVYVLHAFQKKSKKGAETPKHEMDLIRGRLAQAERAHADREKQKGKSR